MRHLILRFCYSYLQIGQWEGDGLGKDISVEAAGKILSEYAQACATKVGFPS